MSAGLDTVGILVLGDNHFIVRGPLPDREAALALARHWSMIQIGQTTPPDLTGWRISTKEFREDLQWAAVVPGTGGQSAAVAQLLVEMVSRGIAIQDFRPNDALSFAGPAASDLYE